MRTKQVAALLAVAGAGMVSFAVVHFLIHEISSVPTVHIVSNLVVAGGAGIGLLYVGYWLSGYSFRSSRNVRILAWTAVGAVTLLAVFVLIQPLAQETVTAEELLHIVQVSVSVGTLLGAAIGSFEVRSLARAEEVTRVESRLAALEDERERWGELNTVLRHYVNNSVTVINFCLDDLRASVRDGEEREHVETIETVAEHVETIETVAEHVDRLGPTAGFENVAPIADLDRVIQRGCQLFEGDADVTISIPDESVEVEVGESVEQDITLLLEALSSLIDGAGEIDCTYETVEDVIVVRFAATPATLPSAVEAALFEPVTRQSGLKLYLAERSIAAYADVRLATNEEETVAFEVRFEPSSH
ncbi:hypothetical protein [Halorhabdus amylolytica]|uniref:hypothetical protein n=1 Tax=Halorhabdus amylolytica TaxID=2559573 RepID=UPI0010A9DC14|nr:hypothetical protein [Halorhabdus amylolytica]